MAVKYLEANGGFLAIGKKMIAQLSDISLSYQVGTEEIGTFDQNFVKAFEPTTSTWTADASFIADDTVTGYLSYTGGTAAGTLTGTTNGFLLLETAKNRGKVTFCIKLDSGNLQRGTVIISSVDVKASSGKYISGSIKLQGSGALTKSAT